MTPFLAAGDVVLIKLGATLAVNDVIVVRLPEGGYAVKCADSVNQDRMRLLSFNPEYEPAWINRAASDVVGTVVARFSTC
jgi:phage repressor protein C with HTH and peptisase S24 domain